MTIKLYHFCVHTKQANPVSSRWWVRNQSPVMQYEVLTTQAALPKIGEVLSIDGHPEEVLWEVVALYRKKNPSGIRGPACWASEAYVLPVNMPGFERIA